ncbi:PorP/SprF family [Maribacter dokdonensis]|uniref:PorP/SprF family type IX secretion system membrane protein n=1 Tax=Maribacter dokdonensis TaxID=320912 RepID=UPI001B05C8F7|nr:type IX secretion system membrane protein PorP/SprF [Maribacter dokdonensis]CAG2534627.1 PorP/SprF family [Maribacter dokdonensis]
MKTNHIYRFIIVFTLLVVGRMSAQQDPNYTFYRFNMNLINPAFAGADETTDFGMNLRSQWSGVQGAPETQSFIFGTPLGKNVGIGLSVINDKTFIENQTAIALDISYKLKLSESHNLYFGIKGGFTSYDANTDGLLTYGIMQDASLMNIDGRFNPNVGAGVLLRHESYFISLSVPKILTPDRLEQNDGLARLGMDKPHMYLVGGYDINLGGNMMLKPSTSLRYVEAAPLSVDITGILEFNRKFGLGAGYRLNESISGLFMFRTNWIDIGYAYEMALENNISNIDNGTHEILMSLRL